MLEKFSAVIIGSLLFIVGCFLLTGSLQQLLTNLYPSKTTLRCYLWSLHNTLIQLLIPAMSILKQSGSAEYQMAAGISVGSLFALVTLAPGVLALFYIFDRRLLLHAPLWDTQTGFFPKDPLVFGSLLLLPLLASDWLFPLRGIGAAFLLWVYLFFFKQNCMAIHPPLPAAPSIIFDRSTVFLPAGLSIILLFCGASYLVDAGSDIYIYDSLSPVLASLFVVPLPALLFSLLSLITYVKEGQDTMARAYLICCLIPHFSLLPALSITLGAWSYTWPVLTALMIVVSVTLLFENKARSPSGLTPILFLKVSAFYPLYLMTLWLVNSV